MKKLTSDQLAVKTVGISDIKKIVKSGIFTCGQYSKLYAIYYDEMPCKCSKGSKYDPVNFIYSRIAKIKK
jgi:hypothetical protein